MSELFAQKEPAALQAEFPNLTVEICIWKPVGAWQGLTGSPLDAFKRDMEEPELCSPLEPAMTYLR
ncbi:MAG: hypothetical protein RQ867_10640 [Mariprofundaceae bacterium]|nr:hypothetical protein [Mariprofundaceae bacterium]